MAPVIFSASLSAQGVFSNNTQVVLEKVIRDYPNHFCHLRGELICQAVQSAEYRSNLQLPGSSSSTVTETGWSCTVLQTTDFNVAQARFSEIYGQLSNSIISTVEQKTYILNGQYEAPARDRKYTQVLFSLLPGVGQMKRLKVELTLDEQDRNWILTVNVSDRDLHEVAQTN